MRMFLPLILDARQVVGKSGAHADGCFDSLAEGRMQHVCGAQQLHGRSRGDRACGLALDNIAGVHNSRSCAKQIVPFQEVSFG